MTNDLASFIDDLSVDPRQHLTKVLLDAIAAVWKDETRLHSVTLDFHAANTDEPVMTWCSYPKNARSEFAEFARLNLDPNAPVVELTPKQEVELAQMAVADAQRGVEKAMQRAMEARDRYARARADRAATIASAEDQIEQLNRELNATDAE